MRAEKDVELERLTEALCAETRRDFLSWVLGMRQRTSSSNDVNSFGRRKTMMAVLGRRNEKAGASGSEGSRWGRRRGENPGKPQHHGDKSSLGDRRRTEECVTQVGNGFAK